MPFASPAAASHVHLSPPKIKRRKNWKFSVLKTWNMKGTEIIGKVQLQSKLETGQLIKGHWVSLGFPLQRILKWKAVSCMKVHSILFFHRIQTLIKYRKVCYLSPNLLQERFNTNWAVVFSRLVISIDDPWCWRVFRS